MVLCGFTNELGKFEAQRHKSSSGRILFMCSKHTAEADRKYRLKAKAEKESVTVILPCGFTNESEKCEAQRHKSLSGKILPMCSKHTAEADRKYRLKAKGEKERHLSADEIEERKKQEKESSVKNKECKFFEVLGTKKYTFETLSIQSVVIDSSNISGWSDK